MPTILQLRRGTTTEHNTFTGAEGEVTVDTTKDTLVVHDGSTVGGFELALADGTNLSGGSYGDSDVGVYLGNNGYTTQSATIAAITDSAPATLDTLNELAAALGDDPNFATTTAATIAANRIDIYDAAGTLLN